MSWSVLPGESVGFVDDLIRHMTFAEKVGQLDVLHRSDAPSLAADVAEGAIGGIAGADLPARIQAIAAERSRLGIPLLLIDDNPQLAAPAAVLAASWDEEIARSLGHALAQSTILRGYNAALVRCGIAGPHGLAGNADARLLVPVWEPLLAARLLSALAEGARDANGAGPGDVMIIPQWIGGEAIEQARWARAVAAHNLALALDAPAFSRRAATQAGYAGMLVAECRRLHAIIAETFRSTTTRTLAEAAERAIDEGALGVHELESAVRGVIAAKHALGLFRHPDRALPSGKPSTPPAELRRRGIVLLRNDAGLLPLSPISDRVLVVGPPEGSAACVADALSRSGISFARAPGLAVRPAEANWESELAGDRFAFSLTRDAAQRADFALVVLDDRHFGQSPAGGFPRPVAPVMGLLRALGSAGSRLACILMTERIVDLGDADQHFAGVLQCGPYGPDLTEALAEVLSGREGPCGRLPVPAGRYSFGQGLSLGECSVSGFKLEATVTGFAASVKVRNAGTFLAHEVVQLYLQPPGDDAPRLVDFAPLTLAPGEETTATFTLDSANLGRVGETGEQSLETGSYTVAIGKHRHRLLSAEVVIGERQVRALSSSAGMLRLAVR